MGVEPSCLLKENVGRLAIFDAIVVSLYILIALRVADIVSSASDSVFFIVPLSTSPNLLITAAILVIGGAIPIVLGIQMLFGRDDGSEIGPVEGGTLTRSRPTLEQPGTEPKQSSISVSMPAIRSSSSNSQQPDSPLGQGGETTSIDPPIQDSMGQSEGVMMADPPSIDDPPNNGEEITTTAQTTGGLVGMTRSPYEGGIPVANSSVRSEGFGQDNWNQKDDTFTSIYAKQREYGQRVSQLLRELQSMANSVVQIPPDVLRSSCMAAYLTSDAVVLMFDRDRTMTTRPLRDFPIEVIVAVVAICAPKLKKSVLEKKQLETGKLHSLEGAIQELEEAKAEVSKEG